MIMGAILFEQSIFSKSKKVLLLQPAHPPHERPSDAVCMLRERKKERKKEGERKSVLGRSASLLLLLGWAKSSLSTRSGFSQYLLSSSLALFVFILFCNRIDKSLSLPTSLDCIMNHGAWRTRGTFLSWNDGMDSSKGAANWTTLGPPHTTNLTSRSKTLSLISMVPSLTLLLSFFARSSFLPVFCR